MSQWRSPEEVPVLSMMSARYRRSDGSKLVLEDFFSPLGDHDDILGESDLEDITDALRSISRSASPVPGFEPTPNKKPYDYSVSLRTEPKVSSFLLFLVTR